MFSSDITKIRLAELKAKGDGGTIQRLRKSCADAAAIFEHTANMVGGRPMSRKQRATLADELRRGAVALRGTAQTSAPARTFEVGDRVRPSKKALSANLWWPNRPVRTGGIPTGGVVVAQTSPLGVRVLWDGRKTTSAYHVDFIEMESGKKGDR